MTPFILAYCLVLVLTFTLTFLVTPLVRFFVQRVGAVDKPNARRVNSIPMPSAGGLGIYIIFVLVTLLVLPKLISPGVWKVSYTTYMAPIILSSGVVVLTGFLDDLLEISARYKMLGIFLASVIIWFFTDFHLDNLKIPFGGPLLHFPVFVSFVFTVFWIAAITNAVNLIDGLDGLASGVSIISLFTMGFVSYVFLQMGNVFLPITIFVLMAAIAGFLPYNFHPASIYLGDTGALFIGFMIAVFSLQGLKNATIVAVLTPIIILGVPIADTILAMIRRKLSGQKISEADKSHLHHRLLASGLTHKEAVLSVYGLALIFSIISILFNISSRLSGILLLLGLLFGVEFFGELVGILGPKRKPLITTIRFIKNKKFRQYILKKKQRKK